MNEDENRTYICIDLKSFFASVECVERNLDPLKTNLVVADKERTEKTICLAVTPSLKAFGIPGRARLFEVVSKVKEINNRRKMYLKDKTFKNKSFLSDDINNNPETEIDFIIATPQMQKYVDYSTKIYNTYLKYVSREDIFVYSIDEVFIDATKYLPFYKLTAKELAMKMINDVLNETHITATAGIGTNMYLAKIAMDIVAKHTDPDENGVRIAELDEMEYRKILWTHQPLTDFWRIGPGISSKLVAYGIYTMGDIARCSLTNEDLLYKLFGVNAELIIDHAWGYENATMESVKAYKPKATSLTNGQVLHCPYDYQKTKTIIREMTEELVLELLNKKLITDQIVLTVGYDIDNLTNPLIKKDYHGEITMDHYGRCIPKQAHGSINIGEFTNSNDKIVKKTMELFENIINKNLLTRRMYVVANHTKNIDGEEETKIDYEQMDLFTDYREIEREKELEKKRQYAETKIQEAVRDIKFKYGKNAILKGYNLKEEGTSRDRNKQIGGHRA